MDLSRVELKYTTVVDREQKCHQVCYLPDEYAAEDNWSDSSMPLVDSFALCSFSTFEM